MKHSFLDKYSGLDSLLHRIDPRVKVLAFFLAVVVVVSEPRVETGAYVFYFAIIFGLIILSRIPLGFILKRCFLASPFILLSAILLPLSHLLAGGTGRAISSDVADRSFSLVLRAHAAVILLTLLTSSDRFHRLLRALRSLKMPPILGVISALMYRYLFILNDERLRIRLARESRTPGRLRVSRSKVIGNQAAVLFLRSWKRAHTVYDSMLARGFSGEFPEVQVSRLGRIDVIFLGLFAAAFLSIRIFL